jgi:V-type H+-transporting ATPase subunit a
MSYCSLIVSTDASKVIIRELGTLGCVQFVDLQSKLTAFQRPFTPLLKRFDNIESKIMFLADQLNKSKVAITPVSSPESFLGMDSAGNMTGVHSSSSSSSSSSDQPMPFAVDEEQTGGLETERDAMTTGLHIVEALEGKVNTFADQMVELNQFKKTLREEYLRKIEFQHLLILSTSMDSRARSDLSSHLRGQGADRGSLLGSEERGGIELTPMSAYRGPGHHSDSEGEEQQHEISFSSIAGTVKIADRSRFERQLYRSTRGNCFVRFGGLENKGVRADHDLKELDERVGFIVFFKSVSIEKKITRICDSFSCHLYVLPSSKMAMSRKQFENGGDMMESKVVLQKCIEKQIDLCRSLSGLLEGWLWVVKREKSTYDALNMCRQEGSGGTFLQARGWIPEDMVVKAQAVIDHAHKKHNMPHLTTLLETVHGQWPEAPTFFRTNKFTYAYQEFVNTYGVPRYREINPALFTAGSFPFLFGVMFGDIGHGTCLTLGALFLVLSADKVMAKRGVDELVKAAYQARYMLLAMGVCAVYCGIIYNDFFSLTLKTFTPNYEFPMVPESALDESGGYHTDRRHLSESDSSDDELVIPNGASATMLSAYGNASAVYPFGVDPTWHIASNDLLFFNSMKMKMAVILGITHMSLGIAMKGLNAIYFKQPLDFYLEFIPQALFTCALFGYMVVLIFMKWTIDWDERMQLGSCNYDSSGAAASCVLGSIDSDGVAVTSCYSVGGSVCDHDTPLADKCPLDYGGTGDGCQPPNLISTLMNMALSPGDVPEPMYEGQAQLQVFLLLFAFLCIPWMLCIKPYLVIRAHNQAHSDPAAATRKEMQSLVRRGATENPLMSGDDSVHQSASLMHGGGIGGLPGAGSSDSYDSAGAGGGSGSEGDDDDDDVHGGHEEHSSSEIVIHQGIETIEFVLGMISNTASYLRLWALSLAHSELSHVFWEKAMLSAINTYNPVFIMIGFYIFAAVTGGVLLCMDLLECFLHALRLHWVEFQNKFYKADGVRFRPLSFLDVLQESQL